MSNLLEKNHIKSVLIVQGTFEDVYESAWKKAINTLGIKCEIFYTHCFTLPGLFGRIERRLFWGPGINRIRKNLVEKVRRECPDITLFYQGHYFDQQTIEQIRPLTFVAGYHNDDPFGTRKTMLRYRLLLPALQSYHGFHVYRTCNIEEARAYGVKNVGVLMPYYLPGLDYPRELSNEEWKRFGSDVIFAGHAENDIRVSCITASVRAGVNLHLHGEDRFWKSILPEDVHKKVKPIKKVMGEDYRKALSGAKIAACFFSKWNRDQYTRRSFEIPACRVFMLSERTRAMQDLYEEGKEAEFFSTTDEFMDKVRFYLKHENLRNQIAEAGRQRVISSGHDIYSRMKQWMADISEWKEQMESA
ncbi:MAG: glycosyltransferase [Nitrospirota bacterium]